MNDEATDFMRNISRHLSDCRLPIVDVAVTHQFLDHQFK